MTNERLIAHTWTNRTQYACLLFVGWVFVRVLHISFVYFNNAYT